MKEPTFETPIIDVNGEMWTPHYDRSAGSYWWTNDSLPEGVSVYCSPFFDGCDGIPLEIISDHLTNVIFEMFPVDKDCYIDEEVSKVLATVKSKLKESNYATSK